MFFIIAIFAFSPAIYKFSLCLNTPEMPVCLNNIFTANLFSGGKLFFGLNGESFIFRLKYRHRVADGRYADKPVVARAHRTIINIDAVFVLCLIIIAGDWACLSLGLAVGYIQILIVVTSLFEQERFLVIPALRIIIHFTGRVE